MKYSIVLLAVALMGCAEGQYRTNPNAWANAQQWSQGMTTGSWSQPVPSVMPVTNCQSQARYNAFGEYLGEAVQCDQ